MGAIRWGRGCVPLLCPGQKHFVGANHMAKRGGWAPARDVRACVQPSVADQSVNRH